VCGKYLKKNAFLNRLGVCRATNEAQIEILQGMKLFELLFFSMV
jgi:hypothetical protein